MENAIYTNKQSFDKTLEGINKDWLNKLHVLADFDGTMTKIFFDWEKRPSLVSLLRNVEKSLWDTCAIKDSKLFNTYHPIEIDPSIDIEVKKEKMIEWWTKSFELFISSWLNKKTLREIAKSEKIKLRKGIVNFLKILEKNKIPLVIISASWIWRKSISYFLEERWLLSDNIMIVSNDFNWDNNWYAISYKEPIIHSFNKWETVLEEFPEIYENIKDRTNVILLWDSLWDHHMVDWFDYKNLLKIWFLNDKEDELLESYNSRYDLVLTWDSEWEILNDLLNY